MNNTETETVTLDDGRTMGIVRHPAHPSFGTTVAFVDEAGGAQSYVGLGDVGAIFTTLQSAARRIQELEQAQRWIPVTERVPEAMPGQWSERVLTCRGDMIGPNRYHRGDEKEGEGSGWLHFTPTHWMPLPAPPADTDAP